MDELSSRRDLLRNAEKLTEAIDEAYSALYGGEENALTLAQNLLVIKTLPGLAPVACSAIDGMQIENLAVTLAGDDTAFLAMRDTDSALRLYLE